MYKQKDWDNYHKIYHWIYFTWNICLKTYQKTMFETKTKFLISRTQIGISIYKNQSKTLEISFLPGKMFMSSAIKFWPIYTFSRAFSFVLEINCHPLTPPSKSGPPEHMGTWGLWSPPIFGKLVKVEIFLEQREVAFLSLSKICENLNFSTVHL